MLVQIRVDQRQLFDRQIGKIPFEIILGVAIGFQMILCLLLVNF